MSDSNKENIIYFESESMKGLYETMDEWQKENKKRLLSTCIQKDGNSFCCIALSNPTEVIILDGHGISGAAMVHGGQLCVT